MALSRHHLAFALALPLLLCGASARADDPAPAAPAAPAEAKPAPYLWVIEGPTRIYLFGTIHIPDPRVMDFPRVVKEAHAAADVVWGEVSVEGQESPKIAMAMFLPAGKALKDVVPAETYAKVQAYLEAREKPPGMVDRFKPIWASIILGMLDAMELMSQAEPMDKLLLKQAAEAGKETGGLETVEEQLNIFESASLEAQARLLGQAMDELEKARTENKNPLEELILAYVKGDLKALHDELAKLSEVEDADVKALAKRLLDDRNVKMVERILERTKKAPEKTYFVLVGAGHYPGVEGILALLDKQGIKARRVALDEKIPAKVAAEAPAPR